MEVLKAPFRLSGIEGKYEAAKKSGGMPVEITGTDGFARYYAMDCIGSERVRLIVTYNEDRAKEIMDTYSFFDRNVL